MPESSLEPTGPIRLAYRLATDDVRRYVAGEDARSWSDQARTQKTSTALLVALVLGLAVLCGLGSGFRAALAVPASALLALGGFGWARRATARRRGCRLAEALGLPADFRVVVSDQGIAKMSGVDLDDPGRRFAWSEVVVVDQWPGLVAFRLRPADAVLLIPSRAFAGPDAEARFLAQARTWHAPAGQGAVTA